MAKTKHSGNKRMNSEKGKYDKQRKRTEANKKRKREKHEAMKKKKI